jgi:Ni/Co efflux regulator RcnB
MKTLFLSAAVAAVLAAGPMAQVQAQAQTQTQTTAPVGGADAKGNAPLKHRHTINDGSAKPGANSFTEGQARQHILNSGYTDVTGLTKGQDGVWRGTATHNGASVQVAMDFKGNVTEAAQGAQGGGGAMTSGSGAAGAGAQDGSGGGSAAGGDTAAAGAASGGADASGKGAARPAKRHARHHRHHHRHGACANPGPNGAACSGVSTLQNGVSDKETHAMQSGAHP